MSAAAAARDGLGEGAGGPAGGGDGGDGGGGGILNRFVQLPGRPRPAGEWRPEPGVTPGAGPRRGSAAGPPRP